MPRTKHLSVRAAASRIRKQLRLFWPARKFEIRMNEANRAVSVHWSGEPDAAQVQNIGRRYVDLGILQFFQTHNEPPTSLRDDLRYRGGKLC